MSLGVLSLKINLVNVISPPPPLSIWGKKVIMLFLAHLLIRCCCFLVPPLVDPRSQNTNSRPPSRIRAWSCSIQIYLIICDSSERTIFSISSIYQNLEKLDFDTAFSITIYSVMRDIGDSRKIPVEGV